MANSDLQASASMDDRDEALEGLPSGASDAYRELLEDGRLEQVAASVRQAYDRIVASLEAGGTLFLCGNGGSMADALHISGELLKEFALPRPVPANLSARLATSPYGDDLVKHLQRGLRVHALGCNPALASAVANDVPLRGMVLAQELYALARKGDLLMALSTSGASCNVLRAVALARALGVGTIGMTGQAPNPLCDLVDIAVAVPYQRTDEVQELHQVLYHRLCLMLEAHFVDRWS